MYAIAITWTAMCTFLAINGAPSVFEPVAAVTEMVAPAAGERSDEAFTAWVRAHAAR